MGLSVQEFATLTPAEFDSIYNEWRDGKDSEARGEWERCRWICYYILKPYAKKSLRKTDVLKFEWDDQPAKGKKKMTKKERAEEKARFNEIMTLWKDDEQDG